MDLCSPDQDNVYLYPNLSCWKKTLKMPGACIPHNAGPPPAAGADVYC